MYLLATSLSVIYASLDYAFTIRIDFTSTTAGLASLASYVQLTILPKSLSSYVRILSLFMIYDSYFGLSLAVKQALRGAPSDYVSGIWIILSCQISANQGECKKHWKTSVKGSDVITNVISANKHLSHRLFRNRCSNSRDVVATAFSFLFPPLCHSAPEILLAG